MITIIASTNRADSMTMRIANIYYDRLSTHTKDVHLLSLQNKEVWQRGESMLQIEQELLIPAQKFVFIMPEYNASFPGILKVMMDNSDIKKSWWYKKAALVGLSDGRAGNLRGVEHMTSILHYMKVHVLYNKVLLSRIKEEVNIDGTLAKQETIDLVNLQIDELLAF